MKLITKIFLMWLLSFLITVLIEFSFELQCISVDYIGKFLIYICTIFIVFAVALMECEYFKNDKPIF